MGFRLSDNRLVIDFCNKECVLKKYKERCSVFETEFAGASKNCTFGIKIESSFIVEKSAESWDGHIHDFGITVDRTEVVKNNIVLDKIRKIDNKNLLKIKGICLCSVELEYIDGYILNTKKGSWLMGEHAFEQDYLDICGEKQLFALFKKILSALRVLHQNGICHTDMMDHNIMIEKQSDRPILIDLIGAMPYSEELAELDKRTFLSHVVLNSCKRKGYPICNDLLLLQEKNGAFEFDELTDVLDKIIKKI